MQLRTLALACLLAVPALVRGAYPPQDPSASLDARLHDIWAQGVDKAYSLYQNKSKVPMAPEAREAFAGGILHVAEKANVDGITLAFE